MQICSLGLAPKNLSLTSQVNFHFLTMTESGTALPPSSATTGWFSKNKQTDYEVALHHPTLRPAGRQRVNDQAHSALWWRWRMDKRGQRTTLVAFPLEERDAFFYHRRLPFVPSGRVGRLWCKDNHFIISIAERGAFLFLFVFYWTEWIKEIM